MHNLKKLNNKKKKSRNFSPFFNKKKKKKVLTYILNAHYSCAINQLDFAVYKCRLEGGIGLGQLYGAYLMSLCASC